MGYKGVSVLDAGYFYCPYLDLDGNVYGPDDAIDLGKIWDDMRPDPDAIVPLPPLPNQVDITDAD